MINLQEIVMKVTTVDKVGKLFGLFYVKFWN